MKITFFGDIFGTSGIDATLEYLKQYTPESDEIIVANAENAVHGIGINEKAVKILFNAGINVITTGNHAFDQKGTSELLIKNQKILRPINYSKGTPGTGTCLFNKTLIVNVMGQIFMHPTLSDPFQAMDEILEEYKLGQNVNAIFVDLHAEATSEKYALAHYLDGRVSAVVGTHTHVPTSDAQILPKGTAYITDVGMCGDYNSVIGVKIQTAIKRFRIKYEKHHFEPANGRATVCGVKIKIDPITGLAKNIKSIIHGPLKN